MKQLADTSAGVSPETPVPTPPPQLPEPGPAKRLRKRLKKNLKAGTHSPESLKAIADQTLNEMRADFHRRIGESEFKTDEELLAELSPYLVKTGSGKADGVTEEVYEEKLLLAYRLHSRGMTARDIARKMQVSEVMARQYLKDVRTRLRVNPDQLDLQSYVGESLYVYKEMQQFALSVMADDDDDMSMEDRLAAARMLALCQRQQEEFLTRIGIYSPILMNQFQTLVFAQNNRMLGSQTVDPQVEFMDNLAKQFMASAAERRQALPAPEAT